MLNIEKVKSMTKAASYEAGPEKENIKISDYFRTDYIGLQMLKSGVAYTVSFAVLAAVWAMGSMEELMLMLTRAGYLERLVKVMILLFAAGLVAYEVAVYAYYSSKYGNFRHSLSPALPGVPWCFEGKRRNLSGLPQTASLHNRTKM